MHELIKAHAVLQQVVDTTHNTENTEWEDPNPHNCNNAGLATNKPAENAEHCCNNVDNQYGSSQLPWGDARPERSIGSRDEDEPILGQRDLQEQDWVNLSEVLTDSAFICGVASFGGGALYEESGERNPGTSCKNNAEQDWHSP